MYDNQKVKVGLHLLDGDGFVIDLNDGVKFGFLPFSYFIYCMKKQNIGVKNFKPFNEMDKEIKTTFLDGVAWVFLGYNSGPKNFDKACKHFFRVLSNAKTLDRGFAWRFNSLKPVVVEPATTTVKVNTIEEIARKFRRKFRLLSI